MCCVCSNLWDNWTDRQKRASGCVQSGTYWSMNIFRIIILEIIININLIVIKLDYQTGDTEMSTECVRCDDSVCIFACCSWVGFSKAVCTVVTYVTQFEQ